MFAKSSSREKRVWKIQCHNETRTLTIFPPCAFRTILELIENLFKMKWPFTIFDEDGVPTILSDCLESGTYTIKEPIKERKRFDHEYKQSYEHKKDDEDASKLLSIKNFPSARDLILEWPPILKTTFIHWRHRKTFNLNIYDTSETECDYGYFYIVGTSEEEKPRKILGLKILSKAGLTNLVTDDNIFYHINRAAVDKEKEDILETNEMEYGPPMTEEFALNKAIKKLKAINKKKLHKGEWRLLDNPKEQTMSYRQERENINILKDTRKKATFELILRYAQKRIDITADGVMNVLKFADDKNIEVKNDLDTNNDEDNKKNIIHVKLTLQEKFDKLLKKQEKAYKKVEATLNEGEEARAKAMKELYDANIRISKKLFFLHELDLEEKRRADNKLARENGAAVVIQGKWKENRKRKKKKKKKKKRR